MLRDSEVSWDTALKLMCGSGCAGKRKKLGFCKAFADVHAANERMHNLFVDWSAANC